VKCSIVICYNINKRTYLTAAVVENKRPIRRRKPNSLPTFCYSAEKIRMPKINTSMRLQLFLTYLIGYFNDFIFSIFINTAVRLWIVTRFCPTVKS